VKAGETGVISAAAGAVGSIAGQIEAARARRRGDRESGRDAAKLFDGSHIGRLLLKVSK
jgi:NADPH-dependent curcumin reductase CurA